MTLSSFCQAQSEVDTGRTSLFSGHQLFLGMGPGGAYRLATTADIPVYNFALQTYLSWNWRRYNLTWRQEISLFAEGNVKVDDIELNSDYGLMTLSFGYKFPLQNERHISPYIGIAYGYETLRGGGSPDLRQRSQETGLAIGADFVFSEILESMELYATGRIMLNSPSNSTVTRLNSSFVGIGIRMDNFLVRR